MLSKQLWTILLGMFITILLGIRFLDRSAWRAVTLPRHTYFFHTQPRQVPRLMVVGDSISQASLQMSPDAAPQQ
jgi:hypothetical protein